MDVETKTTYRLVWGDGGYRHSDDLEALQDRCDPRFGDYIEQRTIVTSTSEWERV